MCTGSSESTHVKMPHCWKSHVTSQMYLSYNIMSDSVIMPCIKINKPLVVYIMTSLTMLHTR